MSLAENRYNDSTELDSLVRDIDRLEDVFAAWDDENKQGAVKAYRASIEALHAEAIRRFIRTLSAEPTSRALMKDALSDEIVYAVLRHLGLVKPSLQERVEQALQSVRPVLASHGGDVQLESVEPPDTVEVRFLGACDGCPASMLTFVAGVKKAIETHCPEIKNVVQAKGKVSGDSGGSTLRFVSPFASGQTEDWQYATKLESIPEGHVLRLELAGADVLLSRRGNVVSCFQNACAHLGLPLHDGEVSEGILTCPHHAFQYDLRSGECLTAPEVQLQPHAVRVIGPRVEVRLAR
jgi:Fe-S cluster biogenesis protein NfuA/nitrite reductase/ring-hydroxylating ferredoxin subunit